MRAPLHKIGELAAGCNNKAPAHIADLRVQVPGCTAAAELDVVLGRSPIPAGGFAWLATSGRLCMAQHLLSHCNCRPQQLLAATMQMWVVLGSVAFVNWFVFEKTKQGLALAVLCAVVAPLSELVLINFLHLWHYPQPDWFGDRGVPSWVSRWIPANRFC